MIWLILLSLLLLPSSVFATPDEADWSFPEDNLEARITAVNEGELNQLDAPPDKPVHHHHNQIRITRESLEQGWVILDQCHSNLDPVAELQIVFHPERIRNIRLISSSHIASVRIEGPSLQLHDIGQQAKLCLQAESRSLVASGDGRYRLKNGPFMRRFLDGYFPMRVTQDIRYPADLLQLETARPRPGKAGGMQTTPGRITWESWFEGRLFTEFDFTCTNGP